jgi:glucose-6-phosphate 1-dehydrogenase
MRMRLTDLDFNFRQKFAAEIPDSYQRLLLDVMHGDASLFARADEVELAWGIIDPIQAVWDGAGPPELLLYEPGNWGPPKSNDWIEAQGRQWFDVCPVLH